MSFELTEEEMMELEKIVQEMNKQAEMALLYDEGTKEHDQHKQILLAYKDRVNGMEPHAKTFVQQGLLDNKDVHDFYWPELEAEALHEKQRAQLVGERDRTKPDMEYRREG